MHGVSGRDESSQQVALSVSGAVQIGGLILMGTVVAVYVGERASPFAVSMAASVYALSKILFAPVWGAVADITGRRRAVLFFVAALGTITTVPFLVVETPWGLIALRGLYGVFAAGLFPVLLSIVSARGDESDRGRAIGRFNSVRSVGFAIAQLLAGALLGALAPRGVFAVIVALNVVMTLTILTLADPTPTPTRSPTAAEVVGEVRKRLLPAAGDRTHLTTNGLHWLYAALMLRHMTWTGIYSVLPIYFLVAVGTTEWEMGVLLALAPAGEILGMLVIGRLTDTIGRKPVVTYGLLGHVAMAALLALASTQSTLVGTVVAGTGLLLKAAAFSALFVGSVAFISDVARERESELMGIRSAAMGVGGVLGPPLVGATATVFGYRSAFLGAGVLSLIGAVCTARHLVESRSVGARIDDTPASADD